MPESSCSPCCQPASIGKKIIMALTGPQAINAYAEWLHSHPGALWIARIILILSVIGHIWTGILLTLENRAARAGGPAVDATRRASLSSRTMPYSGIVILAFLVFHLLHYTFRKVALGGKDFGEDVYAMVVFGFSSPAVSVFYIVSMLLLCLHLSHGVSSVFQTLGLRNERWRGRVDLIATAYGWIIALGFISIPLAVLLGCIK
ncbi:MAG: succinate:quinone oxidoreductase [Verrucomicrobia bacterium]|nr:succinate:quinone oxidoreductase [Verrucomicrobiota bacterium]